MKKLLTGFFRVVCALVLVTVGLALVADLYFELIGLPAPLGTRLVERLAARGITVRTNVLKLGVANGIVAEQITVAGSDDPERVLLRAGEIRVRLNWRALTRGHLRPGVVRVREAELLLPGPATDSGGPPPSLTVSNIELNGRSYEQGFYLREAVGRFGGAQLEVLGRIADLSFQEPSRQDLTERIAEWLAPHWDGLQRLSDLLEDTGVSPETAAVRMSFDASGKDPSQFRARGRFRFSDVVIRKVALRLAKGRFQCGQGRIDIKEFHVSVGRDEFAAADVSFWPATRLLSGEAVGRVFPATLFRLVGKPLPEPLRAVDFTTPVTFDMTLFPSPPDPWQWHAAAALAVDRFDVRQLHDLRFQANVEWADATCRVRDCDLRLSGAAESEAVHGSLVLQPRPRRIAAQLEARGFFLRRLAAAGLALPRDLHSHLELDAPGYIRFNLAESPYDYRQWRGTGVLEAEDLRCRGFALHQARCTLDLEPGLLTADPVHVELAAAAAGGCDGRIAVQFDGVPDGKPVLIKYDLAIAYGDTAGPGPAPPGLAGTLTVDPDQRRLSGAVRGHVYPGRLYRMLCETTALESTPIALRLVCRTAPLEVALDLPECGWDGQDWALEGTLAGEQISYGGITATRVRTVVRIDRDAIRFSDGVAALADGTRLEKVRADVHLRQPRVSLSGEVTGNPDFAAAFIENPSSRELYHSIWRGVEWDPAQPPRIRLELLDTCDGPQEGDWWLQLRGHLAAAGVTYRGLATDAVELDVELNLPERLAVSNIVVRGGQTTLRGDVQILTEGLSNCRFTIGGVCDPVELLGVIHPGWEDIFAECKFAPDTQINCEGEFFFGPQPRTRLRGTLKAPSCDYLAFPFQDLDATWSMGEARVNWNQATARLHGGDVYLSGYYDMDSQAGQVSVRAENIDLEALHRQTLAPEEGTAAVTGRLGGDCHLRFLRDWSGVPLQLNGNGRLQIDDGDLWNVPILSELGRLLDVTLLSRLSGGRVSSLGKISSLAADLEFRGRRVTVPRLQTDGTIVSLRGQGEYLWPSRELAFSIEGDGLPGTGILTLFMRPLFWVFNADLTGTVADHKWSLNTPLRRALPDILGGTRDATD